MNKGIIISMAVIIALSFFSCNNDDTTEKEQDAQEAAIRASLKTQGIMKALCQIDTLYSGKLNYTPRIGKVIESATPTVYYTIGYDLADARQTFQRIISPLNTNEEEPLELDEIWQGNIHLKFSESNTPGEIARITVDCQDLKDVLTEIVFIPEERWPTNDYASPFNLGSIWKYKNRIYVCVCDARCNVGYMLTFDGDWNKENEKELFEEYDHWQGQFYLWKYPASSEAFYYLWHLLCYKNNLYKSMLDNMKELVENPNPLWESLYNDAGWYVFDNDYSYTHGLWWAYNCYYVDLNKSIIIKSPFDGSYLYTKNTKHYEHKETPQRSLPSHEFQFGPGTPKDGWVNIYKGT